jgi:hypothetical protein
LYTAQRDEGKSRIMHKFAEDLIVVTIGLLGTSVVGFGLALVWFRSVGRALDRETVLFAGKIFGGLFVGGILFFLAIKFL